MKAKDIPQQDPEEIVVAQALSQLREERNSPKDRSRRSSSIKSGLSPTGSFSSQSSFEPTHSPHTVASHTGASIPPSQSHHSSNGHTSETSSITADATTERNSGAGVTKEDEKNKNTSITSTDPATMGSSSKSATASVAGSRATSVETDPTPAQVSTTPTGEPAPEKQWRNMLLTATSLVLTKQTRRKFRKLLSVLKLASEHLNTRVVALRETMEVEASQDNKTPKLSSVAIRNDIILTIKKCVAVLSTLATSSLPAAASEKVRNHILCLPEQWANQLEQSSKNAGIDGKSESAVLALASETLISIRKITNVLTETLERADSWVEKLPTFIGKRMRDAEEPDSAGDLEGLSQDSNKNDENSTNAEEPSDEKLSQPLEHGSPKRPNKSLKKE